MVDDDVPPADPKDWSMVVIHDDEKDAFVFPPINHENLQIPQHSSSSSPSSFSSSDSDLWTPSSSSSSFDSQISKGGDFVGWMSIGVQILRSKLLAAFSSFRNCAADRGTIWSFWVPAAALLMSCWVAVKKWKRRRRILTPNETRLINIIKEKDGKIAQLLHQIAQMNKLLIDRHKALAAKVVE
ncbi:uncharacterized protein LOC113848086 [Abrus precatorius]|uniref:Uncharacterized protein LOC113848086 n=1 Tax=Abrus precatorius TaxID=3816 RepID=A0A8B8JP80_ABRPR|nr:uncharacterized protein LOC113848086 [Abrus precatorius]